MAPRSCALFVVRFRPFVALQPPHHPCAAARNGSGFRKTAQAQKRIPRTLLRELCTRLAPAVRELILWRSELPQRAGAAQEEAVPAKSTVKNARRAKRQGKSPTRQAREFVHEEIRKVRRGEHGARSAPPKKLR